MSSTEGLPVFRVRLTISEAFKEKSMPIRIRYRVGTTGSYKCLIN